MKLYFKEIGKGTPLIILHGLYGSSDNWLTIAKSLSNNFRVILPDLRNHGKSPHSADHNYQLMSEDILELADHLGLNKFIIAGHSMGGKAAIYFALRWPGRVAGLIVLDMSPFRTSDYKGSNYHLHLNILELMNSEDPRKYRDREEAVEVFSKIVASKQVVGFLMKNLSRRRDGGYEWRLNPRSLLDNIDSIMDGLERTRNEISEVKGFPVLFLRAEKSGYITDIDMLDIPKIFPAAEIVTVKDTTHWLHAEKPDIILDYIREFAT
jgi:pimeloyl-ACP methyl ester carboxylesterase